jgi:hypothetical protein
MTVPGVGVITALTFRHTIDDSIAVPISIYGRGLLLSPLIGLFGGTKTGARGADRQSVWGSTDAAADGRPNG